MSDAPACVIRPCTPADAQALALLGPASFLEAFAGVLQGGDILGHCAHAHTLSVYRQWLSDPHTQCWLAETVTGAAPVGYLVLSPADLPIADLAPSDLEIKRVYLLHRFQGLGLGRQLMHIACAHAAQRGSRRLLLGVFSQNHSAIEFYRALGYQPIGTRTFRVGAADCHDLILSLPIGDADSPRQPAP